MHIALSWDIHATGTRWTEINTRLKAALQGYSWVRPLKSLYVVKVASAEERAALKDALITIAKDVEEKVYFVMSPPMVGGTYSGWLPRDLWAKIAQRTEP